MPPKKAIDDVIDGGSAAVIVFAFKYKTIANHDSLNLSITDP